MQWPALMGGAWAVGGNAGQCQVSLFSLHNHEHGPVGLVGDHAVAGPSG